MHSTEREVHLLMFLLYVSRLRNMIAIYCYDLIRRCQVQSREFSVALRRIADRPDAPGHRERIGSL